MHCRYWDPICCRWHFMCSEHKFFQCSPLSGRGGKPNNLRIFSECCLILVAVCLLSTVRSVLLNVVWKFQ